MNFFMRAAGNPQSILDRNIIGVNTSVNGEQVFLCIGDSNFQGISGEASVVVPSNTMYYWNGAAWVMTTNGVNILNPGQATMFEEFIIAYNARTGYKGGFVQKGLSSTSFGPNGADFNLAWARQPRYTLAVSQTNAGCAAWGITKPKAILINLGINDTTLGTQQYFDEVFDDLTADFPGVPIIVIQPGRTAPVDANEYAKRKIILDQVIKRANVWFCGMGAALRKLGDNLHYSKPAYGDWGRMLDRLFYNSVYTNKWVRSIISQHFDDLTTARKDILEYVFTRQIANGNFFKLEALNIFQTGDLQNIKNCFTFLSGYRIEDQPELIANDAIRVGSDSALGCMFRTTHYNSRASQNDVIMGVRVSTITTPVGTSAALFGAIDANARVAISKNATSMFYTINDLTAAESVGVIQNDSLYCVTRNGTTKQLLKDGGTILHSSSIASTGTPSTLPDTSLGAQTNSSGVRTVKIEAKYKYFFAAKYDGFDLASFYTDMEYLIANW